MPHAAHSCNLENRSMDPFTLKPSELAVDSFEIGVAEPVTGITKPPTGMKTYEPGCTTPELCGDTTTVAA
jgi:hypothetical protein